MELENTLIQTYREEKNFHDDDFKRRSVVPLRRDVRTKELLPEQPIRLLRLNRKADKLDILYGKLYMTSNLYNYGNASSNKIG